MPGGQSCGGAEVKNHTAPGAKSAPPQGGNSGGKLHIRISLLKGRESMAFERNSILIVRFGHPLKRISKKLILDMTGGVIHSGMSPRNIQSAARGGNTPLAKLGETRNIPAGISVSCRGGGIPGAILLTLIFPSPVKGGRKQMFPSVWGYPPPGKQGHRKRRGVPGGDIPSRIV